MTFLQIQQAVYRRVKLGDSPSTVDSTRIKMFINQWYRRVLGMPGMDQLRDTTITFDTVADQAKYGLPQALVKIRDIYDLTNQRRVLPRTLDWLRNVDPGLTAVSSFTENWIPLNGWGAQLMELDAAGVTPWASSTSAADTTQTVTLECLSAGTLAPVTLTTVLTGTARVAFSGSVVEIVKCYVDAVCAGDVRVFDAGFPPSNQICLLTAGRTSARSYMIQLYPTPGAAVTLSVDCQRAIQDLVNPTEEPLLPEDFHDLLVHLACYEEWLNRDDNRALREYNPDPRGTKGQANIILENMRHFLLTSPDAIPVQRGPRGTTERVSRLGGWFPAGT